MNPSGQAPIAGSIASARIDPSAEPVGASAAVSGTQEKAYFDQGKAEYDYKIAQSNLGKLGSFFGASSSAPGATNIAGLIAILALFGLFATYALPAHADLPDIRKLLLGLISSALAFIFGAASKGKGD